MSVRLTWVKGLALKAACYAPLVLQHTTMHYRLLAMRHWCLLHIHLVLLCAAVCCCVLLCAAVCYSVWQCVAVCGSVWQCVAVCCSVLQCIAVCCSALQCVAVCCSVQWDTTHLHAIRLQANTVEPSL